MGIFKLENKSVGALIKSWEKSIKKIIYYFCLLFLISCQGATKLTKEHNSISIEGEYYKLVEDIQYTNSSSKDSNNHLISGSITSENNFNFFMSLINRVSFGSQNLYSKNIGFFDYHIGARTYIFSDHFFLDTLLGIKTYFNNKTYFSTIVSIGFNVNLTDSLRLQPMMQTQQNKQIVNSVGFSIGLQYTFPKPVPSKKKKNISSEPVAKIVPSKKKKNISSEPTKKASELSL